MSWLDPPPLVSKPRPPEVRLPPEVRPRNVTIMVLTTAILFAAMAFGIGFAVFTALGYFGLPIGRIRDLVLPILTGLGGLVGYASGWKTIQEAIRDHQTHDHV